MSINPVEQSWPSLDNENENRVSLFSISPKKKPQPIRLLVWCIDLEIPFPYQPCRHINKQKNNLSQSVFSIYEFMNGGCVDDLFDGRDIFLRQAFNLRNVN